MESPVTTELKRQKNFLNFGDLVCFILPQVKLLLHSHKISCHQLVYISIRSVNTVGVIFADMHSVQWTAGFEVKVCLLSNVVSD